MCTGGLSMGLGADDRRIGNGFSDAAAKGLWSRISAAEPGWLVLIVSLLLAAFTVARAIGADSHPAAEFYIARCN